MADFKTIFKLNFEITFLVALTLRLFTNFIVVLTVLGLVLTNSAEDREKFYRTKINVSNKPNRISEKIRKWNRFSLYSIRQNITMQCHKSKYFLGLPNHSAIKTDFKVQVFMHDLLGAWCRILIVPKISQIDFKCNWTKNAYLNVFVYLNGWFNYKHQLNIFLCKYTHSQTAKTKLHTSLL